MLSQVRARLSSSCVQYLLAAHSRSPARHQTSHGQEEREGERDMVMRRVAQAGRERALLTTHVGVESERPSSPSGLSRAES